MWGPLWWWGPEGQDHLPPCTPHTLLMQCPSPHSQWRRHFAPQSRAIHQCVCPQITYTCILVRANMHIIKCMYNVDLWGLIVTSRCPFNVLTEFKLLYGSVASFIDWCENRKSIHFNHISLSPGCQRIVNTFCAANPPYSALIFIQVQLSACASRLCSTCKSVHTCIIIMHVHVFYPSMLF